MEVVDSLMTEQDRLAVLNRKSLDERVKLSLLSDCSAKENQRTVITCRNAVIDNLSRKAFNKIGEAEDDLQIQLSAIDRRTVDVLDMDKIGTFMQCEWIMWFTGEEDNSL